jgi:Prp8 binding protein
MSLADAEPTGVVVVPSPLVPTSAPSTFTGPPPDVLLQLAGHGAAVTGLSWHPTAPLLASSSFDKTVLLWDVGAPDVPAVAQLQGHTSSVTAVAFCAAGDLVATASADKTAAVYDAVTGQRLRVLKGHTSHVTCVDGGAAVLDRAGGGGGSGVAHLLLTGGNDCTARVWDSRERRRACGVVLSHAYQVLDVAFGAEEWTVFSAGIDPRVHVWDTRRAAAPVRRLDVHGGAVTGLSVSPLGGHLASYGSDGRVGVWDVRPFVGGGDAERLERALDGGAGGGFEKEMLRCGWDRCGTRIAAGSGEGEVLVWDADDGELLFRLTGHTGCVNDVKFCPVEDTLVASASSDATVIVGHLPPSVD